MTEKEYREIIECLTPGRTVFYYFRDKYARQILQYLTKERKHVRDIKATPFKGLLEKKDVRELIALAPDGMLYPELFEMKWPESFESYTLTVGQWGRGLQWGAQKTRAGLNIVLQMNFNAGHNRAYTSMIKPKDYHPFEYSCHPIAGGERRTMAWARIDLDLTTGEALIEEIQNDWIRVALRRSTTVEVVESLDDNRVRVRQLTHRNRVNSGNLHTYVEDVLKPHVKIWDEAMLAAALWFIREEMGIRRIFYHEYESGNRLKDISYKKPPRSIYTDLPRRFCFKSTKEKPEFLLKEPKLVKRKEFRISEFQVLDL
ncbi:MAG: hypothetical protein V4642_00270 [Bacteroidota bacterium]